MEHRTIYPLATSSWDEEEYAALDAVIKSGMFTMGKHVAEYERVFADRFGSRFAVMCSSGSTANLLMTAALFYTKTRTPLKRGDEVIVPAVSWSTTYYPLYQYGLKLKFVDIDKHTLNYDLGALESAITDETRAIMCVNLLGNPNDFAKIKSLIGDRRIYLIEDNCESMGAKFEGKECGSFGLMGTFSSFFSHHISTMEGGCVITDDEELYHILLCLRAHGWTRNLPKFNHVTGEKSDDQFQESWNFVLPGYNVRPLEMSGALGLKQLVKLDKFVAVRRENAVRFCELFGNARHLIIQKEVGESSWFGFSLILNPDSGISRSQFANELNSIGIECRAIVAGNFAKNVVVKYFNHEVHQSLKNADLIDQQGLFVGNHHFELSEQMHLLRKVTNKFGLM